MDAVSDFKVNNTRRADTGAHGACNAQFPVKPRGFFSGLFIHIGFASCNQ
jgi:hypothetical protein